MKKLGFPAFVLLCGASTHAFADPEHDRIATDRGAANTRLAAQVHECETRFIVANCLEEARKENRAALADLRQQEIKLDEGQRLAAAAARRKAIAEKAEAQMDRASDASSDAPRVRTPREPSAPPAPLTKPIEAPASREPSAAVDRPATEQSSRAKFDARARAAQEHRDAVARRNAQRAAQGKVAAPLPLPLPPGASAAH